MSRHHNEPVVLLPGPDRFTSDALRAAVERPAAPVAAPPTQEELVALGLDEASVDAAWEGVLAAIRAEGGDPDAMVERAADTLAQWRANPAPTPDPDGIFDALDTMNCYAEARGLCDGSDALTDEDLDAIEARANATRLCRGAAKIPT